MDSAVREPSRRMLEKRYGSVKALLRDRAEELSSDMRIKLERIKKIEDIGRLAKHIEVYDGTVSGLLVSNVRNVVNLYEVDLDGEKRDMHVVWIFDGMKEFTKNRYRYNEYLRHPVSQDLDILYNDHYSNVGYNPLALGYRRLEKIYSDPSLMAKIDGLLLDAYAEALKFYHWRVIPSGLVIGGDAFMAGTPMGQSSDYGNDALGIIIGKRLIDKLIAEYKNGDYDGMRMAITALLVHELTHIHTNSPEEIATYAMTLMIEPHINPIKYWIMDDVEAWISYTERYEEDDLFKKLSAYEFDKYLGFIVAVNEFAKYNHEIKKLFEQDDARYKLKALHDSIALIRKSDIDNVIGSGFKEKALDGDLDELAGGIDIIEMDKIIESYIEIELN